MWLFLDDGAWRAHGATLVRELSNRRRHRRQRSHECDERFDVAFALVRRGVEELRVVLLGEHAREHDEGAERQPAVAEPLEHLGNTPGRAGRLDSLVRGGLGEMQHLRAVGEEGRTAGAEIKAPRVQLGEGGDEIGSGPAFLTDQRLNAREQRVVGQRGEERHRRHAPL